MGKVDKRMERESGMPATADPEGLADLESLLEAYGADPARWPVDDPRRPKAWAASQSGDPAAQELVRQAQAFDTALDHALGAPAAPKASAALTGAILQAAPSTTPQSAVQRLNDWATRFWKPVAALSCAAFLGVMVGVIAPVPVSTVAGQQTASLEMEVASLGSLDGGGGFEEFVD